MAVRPICPECGKPLTKRVKRHTGEVFWACTGFPECKFTEPLGGEPVEKIQKREVAVLVCLHAIISRDGIDHQTVDRAVELAAKAADAALLEQKQYEDRNPEE